MAMSFVDVRGAVEALARAPSPDSDKLR